MFGYGTFAELTFAQGPDDGTPPPAGVMAPAGLHPIAFGIGDLGNGTVPQTLHTIDQGISA